MNQPKGSKKLSRLDIDWDVRNTQIDKETNSNVKDISYIKCPTVYHHCSMNSISHSVVTLANTSDVLVRGGNKVSITDFNHQV